MPTLDRTRLKSLAEREQKRFVDERPKSKSIYERGKKSLLSGVPMNWVVKWAGAFPPVVREAQGAHFYDVDGHRYVDFCLGDTGAMTGHSPFATAKAIEEQVKRGITLMLPSEDAVGVGEELQRRFGLPYWQFALTATDANRFSIRLARQITGRPKILVFNWCYHGSVDETFITVGERRVQSAPWKRRPTRRSFCHHKGGRIQRCGGARKGPSGRRCCLRARALPLPRAFGGRRISLRRFGAGREEQPIWHYLCRRRLRLRNSVQADALMEVGRKGLYGTDFDGSSASLTQTVN